MSDCDGQVRGVATVYQGEDYPLSLIVMDGEKRRYDLTGLTAQVVELQNADGSVLSKPLTIVGSPLNGELTATLTDAETALLRVGERQTIQAILDFGSNRRVVVFDKALSVRRLPVA